MLIIQTNSTVGYCFLFFLTIFRKDTHSCLSRPAIPRNSRRRRLHALATATGTASYVPALKRYLAIHYGAEISSSSLEEMFHCNFDHLNRIFKKTTGDTIFAILNRIRIENAKKYLATGIHTCSEVAVKCGVQ